LRSVFSGMLDVVDDEEVVGAYAPIDFPPMRHGEQIGVLVRNL
jgi:hypothetical protein